jgi:phosphatidylserine decarboxylase
MCLSALDKHIFTSKAEYTLAQIDHFQGTLLNIRNLKINRIRKWKKIIIISEGGFLPTLLTSTALKEATL